MANEEICSYWSSFDEVQIALALPDFIFLHSSSFILRSNPLGLLFGVFILEKIIVYLHWFALHTHPWLSRGAFPEPTSLPHGLLYFARHHYRPTSELGFSEHISVKTMTLYSSVRKKLPLFGSWNPTNRVCPIFIYYFNPTFRRTLVYT